jgi:hypothetical protein
MLYNRNILPACSYCRFGTDIGNAEIACVKRGIMSAIGCCRLYAYDPLKRVPDRRLPINAPVLEKFPEDINYDPEAEREAQLEAEINARLNAELNIRLDSDLPT